MRIDQFLNSVNITKSRNISQDMCENKVVFLNGTVTKNSKKVQVGDKIKIAYLEDIKTYEILALPTTKHTNKKDQNLYIKEL